MKHRIIRSLAIGGLLLIPSLAGAQGWPDAGVDLDSGPGGGWPDSGGWPDAGGGYEPGDILALYCDDVELSCTSAPLNFEKVVELPIAFDWDTGWIPSGSDLQVRFYVKVPAETKVQLAGSLQTEWPPALRHLTPGKRNGGLLAFEYGLEVGAKARIDWGPVNWSGDIPFIPQVDFNLSRSKVFDSWAFDGSPPASAYTDTLRLFEINLLNLVGIPSQIAKGGVALDIYGELSAVYTTHRIRIEPSERDIEDKGDSTTSPFAGGGFAKFDVWPEGEVRYTGAIHLVPTFFAKILGFDLNIPFVDYPIEFPLGSQSFVFDPVRVHVPLPDIPTPESLTVDFGEVVVGERGAGGLKLENIGEAKARVVGFLGSTNSEHFTMLSSSTFIEPADITDINLRFNPKSAGQFSTDLTLVTNDPDNRFINLTLTGTGVGQERPDYAPDGSSFGGSSAGLDGTTDQASGCACQLPGSHSAQSGALSPLAGLSIGLFGLAFVKLRRSRRENTWKRRPHLKGEAL